MNTNTLSALKSYKPLCLLIVLSFCLSVQAQDTTDELEEELTGPKILEGVTVTAQKKEENVQEVPVAVTVLTGEKLNILASGGLDVRFLSSRLPSLQIESSFGRTFPRFYIRGFGNTDFDLNASQPVSLVYDGIVQENPILKGFPVFDLDRIENLLGPQGTLFGRNTPAGIVKFESARPSQISSGYAQLSYGKFNNINFEGAYGGAISPNWSYRLSAYAQRRDDWVDNNFTGEENALEGFAEGAARLQLLYDNSDNFEALFNIHARSTDGTARLFRANIIEPGTNDLVEGFNRDDIAVDGQNEQDIDSIGGSMQLTLSGDRIIATSLTGFEAITKFASVGDIDGGFGAVFAPPSGPGFIPFTAETEDALPEHFQFTQEARLESNDWGRFDWTIGMYYFHEDITIESTNFDTLAGSTVNGFARQEQQTDTYAVFASGDFDITDRWNVRAGFRLSRDEKSFVAERTESPLSFLGVGPIGPLFADPEDTEYSWDFSSTYALTDSVNVYGRLARGFRAPSIQGRVLFGDIVTVADTETVFSYEAGVKSLLADGRLRLNFSVFRYLIDDQQLTAVGGEANFNQLVNADQTEAVGFELDAEAFITDNLYVTAGLSYNETEIDDANLAVAPCASGCTVLDPAGPVDGTVLIDGNSLPQAPEWVANITARYGIPVGSGEIFLYTDWAYRSEVSFFLYESVEYTGDQLLEGGVRVGYTWNFGDQEIAAFGRNITDDVTIVGGIDFNNLTGFVNEPRTWGVEYTHKF